MIRIARNLLLLLLAILATAWLTSCRTRYITIPEVSHHTDTTTLTTHDTVRLASHEHEATVARDSVFVMLRGDTVYKEVWRWRDRVSIVRDTVHDGRTRAYTQVVRDSVRVPVAVEVEKRVEVERPLSWWQRTLHGLGWLALAALACAAAWWTYRYKK